MTYTALYAILALLAALCVTALALCARLAHDLRWAKFKVDHLQSHIAFMNSSLSQLETKVDALTGYHGMSEDDRK